LLGFRLRKHTIPRTTRILCSSGNKCLYPPCKRGGFVASQPESRNTRRCCLHHLRVGDLLGFRLRKHTIPRTTRIPLFLREQVSVPPVQTGWVRSVSPNPSRGILEGGLHHLRVGDLLGFRLRKHTVPRTTRIPLFLREQVSVPPVQTGWVRSVSPLASPRANLGSQMHGPYW